MPKPYTGAWLKMHYKLQDDEAELPALRERDAGAQRRPRGAAKRAREPRDETRLAGAERPGERDHVAGAQGPSERLPQPLRVLDPGGPLARRVAHARGALGRNVTMGSTISSRAAPPCWNEPLNWRSYSWKCVGYTK